MVADICFPPPSPMSAISCGFVLLVSSLSTCLARSFPPRVGFSQRASSQSFPGMEYDPLNKLNHTTYWYESSPGAEWPLSEWGRSEAAADRGETPAPGTVPDRFHITLETTGAIEPTDVVLIALEQLVDKLTLLRDEVAREMVGGAMPAQGAQSVWGGQGAQSMWGGGGAQSVWNGGQSYWGGNQ